MAEATRRDDSARPEMASGREKATRRERENRRETAARCDRATGREKATRRDRAAIR